MAIGHVVGHLLGGGPSSGGHPQAVAPLARVPPGVAEAGEDEDEAAAAAEAGARTEAEAPTGAVTGAEAAAVTEAGEAGKIVDAAGGRERPGAQPREAGTACSQWSQPLYGGWQTPGL
jgi:hypothetical protein